MHPDLPALFEKYMDHVRDAVPEKNPARDDLASEVIERLQQLAFITQNLDEMNAQFGKMVMVERLNDKGEKEMYNGAQERDKHLLFVMRLLTESFYYFAFRVRQILRNKVHPFPFVASFESVGVRDVRNHLIEHPEGRASLVFNRTFMWYAGSGMHLKSGRQEWEKGEFIDAGLKVNAAEFAENLYAVLQFAIDAHVGAKNQPGGPTMGPNP
jgi:hypothetical protein